MIRHSWLAGAAGLALAAAWLAAAAWPRPVPEVPALTAPVPVGGGSSPGCAAVNCHGAAVGSEAWRSAATVWGTEDRHSRAYGVLLEGPSRRISERLGAGPAHENPDCLACHAPGADPSEGVGCQACHGDAARWLPLHTGFGHRRDEMERHGMTWLGGPAERAAACVGCHVGAPGREVNHDLIAAGHPRLNFEFLAYLEAMPPHWGRHDAPARAWSAGQLATMKASLDLLESRAGRAEFSEQNCFDCHHDLGPRRAVRSGGWHRAHALERLAGPAADELLKEMRRAVPRASKTALAAARAGLRPPPDTAEGIREWLRPLDGAANWDEAGWTYHALAAAGADVAALREELALRRPYDSPRHYRPAEAARLIGGLLGTSKARP